MPDETEGGRVPLASDRSAVAFNSDPTGNRWQTDGVAELTIGVADTALSVTLAFAGRTIVSAPLPAAQSG